MLPTFRPKDVNTTIIVKYSQIINASGFSLASEDDPRICILLPPQWSRKTAQILALSSGGIIRIPNQNKKRKLARLRTRLPVVFRNMQADTQPSV